MSPSRPRFILRAAQAYPGRTALLVVLLLLAALAEGVGLVTLLPLLEIAVGGADAAPSSTAGRMAVALVSKLGIPLSLGPLLALIVAVLALKAVLRWLAMGQVGYGVAAVAKELRLRLLAALFAARWSHFVDEAAGSLSNALGLEAFRASLAYRQACAVLALGVQLLVYVAVMLLVSPRIAAGALLLAGVLAILLSGFVGMSRRAGEQRSASADALVRGIVDVLPGMKAIKAMGREAAWLPRAAADAARLEAAERRGVFASESLRSFQEPLTAALVAAGLYAALAWGGGSLPELLLLVLLLHRILSRAQHLQAEYQGMVESETAFHTLEEATRRAHAAAEPATPPWGEGEKSEHPAAPRGVPEQPEEPAPVRPPAIALRGVTFAYGGKTVLDDVSIDIPPAALTLLVGPSGAGKTTLADLVTGLHEPLAGRILVDGTPLDAIPRAAWRRRIGYVPQDASLLHESVAANVALGAAGVGPEEVARALEQAGAADLVGALPGRTAAQVGERGARLSGGQRQRLALARALVCRPALLVLDEATAGIDPAAEERLAESIGRLRGQVTILAVAHRSRLEALADVIYRIDGGRVTLVRGRAPHASSSLSTSR